MTTDSKPPKYLTIKEGIKYYPDALTTTAQDKLLIQIRQIMREAPLFTPTMPRTGKPFSVQMTNCGSLGWISDKKLGYRYEFRHPVTGNHWPPIPETLIKLWHQQTKYPAPPEACLINYYSSVAQMGLHTDDDENEPTAPILSLSLGDTAWFRIGGLKRNDPTSRIKLKSGDVLVMSGPARFIYHGIDRILPDTSKLIPDGGRINLTLRRVNPQPLQ